MTEQTFRSNMPRSTENNADTTSEKELKKKKKNTKYSREREREREREKRRGKKTLFRTFVDSIGWKLV